MTREDEARELLADLMRIHRKGGLGYEAHSVLKNAINFLTRPSSPASVEVERKVLTEAAKPWADYHGDLPDYDHPLRPVYESGIQYAVELLAKELGVEDYTPCDGTEEFDGDLGGTLMNIVLEAMPKDEHGDPIYPRDLPAALTVPARPEAGEVERLIEQAKMWLTDFDDDRRDMQLEHDHAERFRSILASLPTARADIGEVAAQHFKVGDRVTKVKGLPFGNGDARVVAVYSAEGGPRVVVQHPEGWQHIFAPDQLALDAGEGM